MHSWGSPKISLEQLASIQAPKPSRVKVVGQLLIVTQSSNDVKLFSGQGGSVSIPFCWTCPLASCNAEKEYLYLDFSCCVIVCTSKPIHTWTIIEYFLHI